MTPDDLSELAECLDDACRKAVKRGRYIGWSWGCIDPLGAAMDVETPPTSGEAAAALRVPYEVARGFLVGYEGWEIDKLSNPEAFALGVSFRERVAEGVYR